MRLLSERRPGRVRNVALAHTRRYEVDCDMDRDRSVFPLEAKSAASYRVQPDWCDVSRARFVGW